ncbi:MAG: methyltransferase domain-containing protein [Deltaproteobacteria bacterium]|nr:methyltransferase domain-containing protein [Deltaproteobacteria bacterium]
MKFLALLVFLLHSTVGIHAAAGQGFRGSYSAPRGAVVTSSSGSTVIDARSGFAHGTVIVSPPVRGFAVAPNVQFYAPPLVVAPQFVPQHYYPYRYAPVARYPSVVIIDTPYVSERTIVTQIAPGVLRSERRPTEVPPGDPRTRTAGQLAPFDPTPQEVVERMLKLAALNSGDVLYDLGAGDGRVVIAAAKKYGAKAVGFEIDPGLVKLARENVRKQGVEHLVEIRQQDFLSAELSPASVVTLYLSYDGNLALRQKLLNELKPGARLVSYTFDMGQWQPKITERYRDGGGDMHVIYFWQIGEPLAFR